MGLFSKLIDKRIAAYQRELIETHYAEVETMYKQIRGWRHDYRNHIQTMKVYAAQEETFSTLTSTPWTPWSRPATPWQTPF